MSTHDGFIAEFPSIRCDRFTADKRKDPADICAYLLTHCHSDHLQDEAGFDGTIYTTSITKAFVANLSTDSARYNAHLTKSTPQKKYSNLATKPILRSGRIGNSLLDRIVIIEYNIPHVITDSDGDEIAIIAIDANHCPGACMFLVQGLSGKGIFKSVLITGDIRAEPIFIESLRNNHHLARFIDQRKDRKDRESGRKDLITLDRIYLDTSMTSHAGSLYTKAESVKICIELIKEYPEATRFFITTRSWGFEALLKGLSDYFETEIHLDFYKYDMFNLPATRATLPELSLLGTTNCTSTRFHACERSFKCAEVYDGIGFPIAGLTKTQLEGRGEQNNLVVNILPGNITKEMYEVIKAQRKLEKGFQSSISLPLTCHSTLPESQTFVGLFKPQSLFPLTLYKQSELFDHLILPYQFRKQLASGGFEQLQEESLIYYKQNVRMTIEQEQELPGMIQKRLEQVSNVEAPIYYLEGDNESTFEPIKSTLKRTEEADFDKIDFTSEESIEVKKRIKKPLSVLPSIEIIEPLLPNIQIVSGSANVGSSKKMAEEENSLDRLEREDQPPTLPTLSPTLLTPSPTILTPSPAQLFSNQKRSLTPGSSPESSPESTFPPSKRFKISPLPTLIRFRTTPLDEEQKRIIAKILADRKSGGFF